MVPQASVLSQILLRIFISDFDDSMKTILINLQMLQNFEGSRYGGEHD